MNPSNSISGKIILISSLAPLVFWMLSRYLHVYKVAWVGALFELLWLPMVILTMLSPIISFVRWNQMAFKLASIYFYAFLISISTIVVILV